jgi:hypothetical protein
MTSPGLLLRTLFQALLLGLCFVAGYLTAGWRSDTRDEAPLARICAQVEYVNSLQQIENKEVRYEFQTLSDQCRAALRDPAEESD